MHLDADSIGSKVPLMLCLLLKVGGMREIYDDAPLPPG